MGSKSSSKSSQTFTPNPTTSSLFNPTYGAASSQINTPFQPFSGELYPGLSAGQNQATQMVNQAVGTGAGAVNSGIAGAQGLLGYTPQQVTAPTVQNASAGPAAQVSPQALSSTNLSSYLDPYTQDVINATNQAIDQQRRQDINGQQGQFTQAGAFGGSREGVSDALTNKYYGQLAAQTAAGLNQANFANAQQAALSDIGNNLQGQLANQSATNANNQFNAGLLANTNLANAGYGYNAQTANQSAGLNAAGLGLSAAGLLGQLGQTQQGLALNDASAVNTLGTQDQQTKAAQDQASYQQYLLGLQYPLEQAGLNIGLLGSLGDLYAGAKTNGTGTQSKSGFSFGISNGQPSFAFG